MIMNERKKFLFDNRLSMFLQKLHLLRTDIVPIVNYSWPLAFGDVENNCKAIVSRGWWPFNRNILLDDLICANMTEETLVWEKTCGYFTKKMLQKLHSAEMVENNRSVLVCSKDKSQLSRTYLNFENGLTAQYLSNTILSSADRQNARARNQKLKEDGTTAVERMGKINRKLTAD